jgi:hypothetical protein
LQQQQQKIYHEVLIGSRRLPRISCFCDRAGTFLLITPYCGGEDDDHVHLHLPYRVISDSFISQQILYIPHPRENLFALFQEEATGVCSTFAVHARTTVTFAGVVTTLHGGDVGVSPGTSVTGAYAINGGELVADSSDFDASVQVAYAAAMAVRSDEQAIAIEIGGKTFTPGTYRSGSAINFAYGTVVVLDGLGQANPVFLFQAGTTLVTAADTYFILKNGAKAENVLWALGTAATLGANSVLEGSILAGTAITFGTQSELHGCALAQSAVTFESEGIVGL